MFQPIRLARTIKWRLSPFRRRLKRWTSDSRFDLHYRCLFRLSDAILQDEWLAVDAMCDERTTSEQIRAVAFRRLVNAIAGEGVWSPSE